MASKQSFGTPDIRGHTLDDLRKETQFWLEQAFRHLDTIAGLRGTPKFFSNLDLNGQLIKNLSNPVDPQDAVPASQALTLNGDVFDAEMTGIINLPEGTLPNDQVNVEQLRRTVVETIAAIAATNVPPAVADVSALGSVIERLAREDHTHRGVDYDAGTFTITGTGFTASVTGTARWEKHRNLVTLFIPQLSGTSNATTFTLTGLPAAITPTQTSHVIVRAQDNSVASYGILRLNNASTTIDMFSSAVGGAWTAAGTKSIEASSITYGLFV